MHAVHLHARGQVNGNSVWMDSGLSYQAVVSYSCAFTLESVLEYFWVRGHMLLCKRKATILKKKEAFFFPSAGDAKVFVFIYNEKMWRTKGLARRMWTCPPSSLPRRPLKADKTHCHRCERGGGGGLSARHEAPLTCLLLPRRVATPPGILSSLHSPWPRRDLRHVVPRSASCAASLAVIQQIICAGGSRRSTQVSFSSARGDHMCLCACLWDSMQFP